MGASSRCRVADAQVARLITLNTELQKNLDDLRRAYAETRDALSQRELAIAHLQSEETQGLNNPMRYRQRVPKIDGRVAALNDDWKPPLVLLTVGSDEHVQQGYQFSIYRGNEFIGKVVVDRVLRDSSSCRALFTKEGATIQSGDSATTRLE